jgi:hypothetical protein
MRAEPLIAGVTELYFPRVIIGTVQKKIFRGALRYDYDNANGGMTNIFDPS